jgi:endonuclease III
MSTKEKTTMAQIDQQAARKELKEAAQLRAKAEQLVEIADELQDQADDHEHDAMDLIAPADTPPSSSPHRR